MLLCDFIDSNLLLPSLRHSTNTVVAVSNAALNNFQSLSAKWSMTRTDNGVTTSRSVALLQYFRLQNMAVSQVGEKTMDGVPVKNEDMHFIATYKPCKMYYNNVTWEADTLDTSVDAAILNKVQKAAKELTSTVNSVPFFNALPVPMSTNGTGNSTDDNVVDTDDDGGFEPQPLDFCTDYAAECASKGDAAAASFALSFILGFVNMVLTFMRVGSDSTIKTWVSLIAHGLCVMFICVAVGGFANGCVNNFVDDYEKAVEKWKATYPDLGAWSFETKTGDIFDCAIAGLTFTVLQLVFVVIFRYQAGRAAPMAATGETTSRETGIASPPPIAPKGAPASEV